MVDVTIHERHRFLRNFTDKICIHKNTLTRLVKINYSHLMHTRKLNEDSLSVDSPDCTIEDMYISWQRSEFGKLAYTKDVFPILRTIEDLTDSERKILEDMNFDFDPFSFSNCNYEQYQYLLYLDIDVPLYFGPNHINNGEFAIDLGIAVNQNEVPNKNLWYAAEQKFKSDQREKIRGHNEQYRLDRLKNKKQTLNSLF